MEGLTVDPMLTLFERITDTVTLAMEENNSRFETSLKRLQREVFFFPHTAQSYFPLEYTNSEIHYLELKDIRTFRLERLREKG